MRTAPGCVALPSAGLVACTHHTVGSLGVIMVVAMAAMVLCVHCTPAGGVHTSAGPALTPRIFPTSPPVGTGGNQRSVAVLARVIFAAPTVGSGYVPVRSPPAAPLRGSGVGAPVTFVHATS